MFNVVAYLAKRWSWDKLIDESAKEVQSAGQDQQKTFYLGEKSSTTLQLDLSTSKTKKGGFKVAAFGTLTTSLFQSDSIDICAKHTYHVKERLIEKNGILEEKSMEVPHDSCKQFQNLLWKSHATVGPRHYLILFMILLPKGCARAVLHGFTFRNFILLNWRYQWSTWPSMLGTKRMLFFWLKK